MVTAPKSWRRWCGPPIELVRATELAADELRGWTGLDSKIDVRLEDRNGLVEPFHTADAIMALHPNDLHQIVSVSVTVTSDPNQWWDRRRRGETTIGESSPDDAVRIRIAKIGTTLEVTGSERTRVEGLLARLSHALGHAATKSPGVPRVALLTPLGLAVTAGLIGGPAIARGLGLASLNGKWEVAEIVGMFVVGVLVAALTVGLWWLYPPIEMLDEGGAGRARRFRKWIIAIIGSLVLAVVSKLLYDALR